MKTTDPKIKELTDGQNLTGCFLVKEMTRAETKAGKPYLILTLMDNSGELGARLWDNADQLIDQCRPGTIARIQGQAQAYRGVLQIKVDTAQALDPGRVDLSRFMPAAAQEIPAMAEEILLLARTVADPFLNTLLQNFFGQNDFFERFKKAPAAKGMHHAYIGGLLEHTLSVAKLADLLAGFYPLLDRDLLLAGALLHDIGKVEELSFDAYPFGYTDKGRLVGHLVLGSEMIQEIVLRTKNFPEDLATRLRHLVLSHHGQHEFGSPCLPMMIEAFVLNFLDDMDAKVQYLKQAGEGMEEPTHQWTDYQRAFERFLFVRGGPKEPAREKKPVKPQTTPEKDPRQKSLF